MSRRHDAQGSLFTDVPGPHARSSDPFTSHLAATPPRAGSQAMRLLEVYAAAPAGLTDLEASERASVRSGWKRCSDLRRLGYISWDGVTTCIERLGREQMVCRITEGGRRALAARRSA